MLSPKSHKDYIKPTAEKLDISPSLVEDCVSFFYLKVRKSLTNLEHCNVHLLGLGTFKIKEKELNKLYKRYENHLNLLENPETFNQMRIKKEIGNKLSQATAVKSLLAEEKERRNQIKKQRDEFINNPNMESKESDI